MRTTYSGTVGSSCISLPWGDGYTATVNTSGADQDNGHYAGLERDAESGTEHAQFRNYASAQGRWLAPDSYMGSYDLTNPQSMNRYSYALNNPGSLVDPSGLKECELSVYGFCLSVTVWDSAPYDGDLLSLDDPIPVPTSDRVRGTTTGNAPSDCHTLAASAGNSPLASAAASYVNAAQSPGQYLAGAAGALAMYEGFGWGVGSANLDFGPNSVQSQQLAASPGVAVAINNYFSGQNSTQYNFGGRGLIAAGWNATAQYVGSFAATVSPGNGVLNITVTNTTSTWSLLYHITNIFDHSRSQFPPYATTTQKYHIAVPCS
jgi:RHS repeat-associated protein